MGKVKDSIYNFLVRKNGRVWYEYERYVRENIEEHRTNRFKHIIVLLKLNWFYRVKKGNTPYLYWDVPLEPQVKKETIPTKASTSVIKAKSMPSAQIYCETKKYPLPLGVHLAKFFAKYDYIVFNLFDTLIYLNIGNKCTFYSLVGQELGIPLFEKIRIRKEEELVKKARISRQKNDVNIYDIYKELEKYIGVDFKKGVEIEIKVLKKLVTSNQYIKPIYDMVSYYSENILIVEDTVYTSEQMIDLLTICGIDGYKELYVSNENGTEISDGTLIDLISKKIKTKNVVYIDDELVGQKKAQEYGWDIWEYRNVRTLAGGLKCDGMTDVVRDLYSSIITQHMYCGQFVHSLQYELGYIYYGIFMVGYSYWLNEQVINHNLKTLFFLEETSDLMMECFKQSLNYAEIKCDVLWITEDFAVRTLVGKYPALFYEYYIKKYMGVKRPLSFYLTKMGLLDMVDDLSDYGLTALDDVSRDSMFYGAFIDFIEDNYVKIQEKYMHERKIFAKYIKSLNLDYGNIGIAGVSGNGYIALALDYVLREELGIQNNVVELSAIRTINANDYLYGKKVKSYINTENVRNGDINLTNNVVISHRTKNILSNVGPVFKRLVLNEDGEFEFIYEDAYPWKYSNLIESQNGIMDFFGKYNKIQNECRLLKKVSSEDVFSVLNSLFNNNDYVKKAFTIIRS